MMCTGCAGFGSSFARQDRGIDAAEVRGGARRGLRALADEEDIGRELVVSLDERQRARTLISAAAPSDIATGNAARVEPLSPVGIRETAHTGAELPRRIRQHTERREPHPHCLARFRR